MRRQSLHRILLAAFLVAAGASAQTTSGRLLVRIVDDDSAVLPGVSVSIASPSLIGGARTGTSDPDGEVLFLSLAPGDYRVTATLAGFASQERASVKVSLGHTILLTVRLPPGVFSEEIEVIDATPVVDPVQVHTGQTFDRAYLDSSAIGTANRTYQTVVNQAAGATQDFWPWQYQSSILGSSMGENAYYIDGLDTTNPVMGTSTAGLNFDAIAEIQLKTAGFEAEFGHATGGIVNVLTRSGGNDFSGTLDARFRDDSFRESGDHYDASELDSRYRNVAATLGGPIARDRAWFFASYQRIDDEDTPPGSPTTADLQWQNYLAKITWQAGERWLLTGKYSADPRSIDHENASRWVLPEATSFARDESTIASAEISGVLSESLLWYSTLGRYVYDSESYPQSRDLAAIEHYNADTGLNSGSYSNQQYWRSPRDELTSDLSWFLDDFGGSHELKAGVEYSDLSFPTSYCSTGTPDGSRCVDGGVGYNFIDIQLDGQPTPYLMWENRSSGPRTYAGEVTTGFVQDTWRPVPSLSVKAGVRYDRVTYDGEDGAELADFDELQPRLGFAWDITRDAKTLLRGSWGRFMHPGSLTLPWFAKADFGSNAWYSCSGILPLFFGISVGSPGECAAVAASLGWSHRLDHEGWDPNGWVLAPWERYASQANTIDPELRAPWAEELVLAFEREVGERSSIELTYVDKRSRDLLEDTCSGNVPVPSADASCDFYTLTNVSALRRDYEGLIVRYETRGLDWLTLLASYVYADDLSSIGYTQNVSGAVDVFPWHFDNIYGRQGPRHTVKLNGYFTLPRDWIVAFDGRWSSPFLWAPRENRIDNPQIPYGGHLLEPRGSREANSNYQLDLQLSKGFRLGPTRLELIGSVLNVFDDERPIAVCERVSGCGEFEMGEPTYWQVPRSYEVGLRVEF